MAEVPSHPRFFSGGAAVSLRLCVKAAFCLAYPQPTNERSVKNFYRINYAVERETRCRAYRWQRGGRAACFHCSGASHRDLEESLLDGVAHHCAKSSEVSAKPINAKIALPKQEAETVFASLFCPGAFAIAPGQSAGFGRPFRDLPLWESGRATSAPVPIRMPGADRASAGSCRACRNRGRAPRPYPSGSNSV